MYLLHWIELEDIMWFCIKIYIRKQSRRALLGLWLQAMCWFYSWGLCVLYMERLHRVDSQKDSGDGHAEKSRGCRAWPAVAKANPCVGAVFHVCVRACAFFQSWQPKSLGSVWRGSSRCFQSSSFLVGSLLCDTIFPYDHLFINGNSPLFHIWPHLLKIFQFSVKLLFCINQCFSI